MDESERPRRRAAKHEGTGDPTPGSASAETASAPVGRELNLGELPRPEAQGRGPFPLEMLEKARDVMTVRRVFGEPIHEGGVTIVPAAHIRGGGGGGGDAQGNGGGGFGVSATPAGAYVIKDGEVRWRPAININRTILGGQIVAIVALLTLRSVVKAIAKRR